MQGDAAPATARALKAACARDPLFYINTFCWTYDPETSAGILPFLTWPGQERALRKIMECIEGRKDLVIEKSRRQGASWLSVMLMEWYWHFRPWKQFLMISRDLFHVDSNSPDSLFWKIDFLHKHQPAWLKPRMVRQKLHFENLDLGSTMTGQASTERAGIGGRATAIFVDEFSRIRDDQEILNGTADTSKCRIFNSTHTGPGTAFYELTRREDMEKLRMHWSENPANNAGLYEWDVKTNVPRILDGAYKFAPDFKFVPDGKLRSPWYDDECRRRANPRAIAMDLDIDPRGTMAQFFDPLLIRDLVAEFCCDPYWRGELHYERESGKPLDLTASPAGKLLLWLHLKPDGKPPLGRYVIGADIAAGTGATPSVLSVANAETGEKVAEYANALMDAKTLGLLAVALGRLFVSERGEAARLIWEHHGPGVLFGGMVLEKQYPNAYMRTQELPKSIAGKVTDRPGWVSNAEEIETLLSEYRYALATRKFINRSRAALEECLDFRYNSRGQVEHAEIEGKKDDPTGARRNHSDRAMADALAWMEAKKAWTAPQQKQERQAVHDPRTLAGRRAIAHNAVKEDRFGWYR
jgi:hypothetical protein